MSDNENTNNKWRSKELGALWARRGKNQNYFSGYVTIGELGFEKKVKIVGFKNNFKDNEKQPDFRLYVSEEQSDSEEPEVKNAQVSETSSEPTASNVEGEDQELF